MAGSFSSNIGGLASNQHCQGDFRRRRLHWIAAISQPTNGTLTSNLSLRQVEEEKTGKEEVDILWVDGHAG